MAKHRYFLCSLWTDAIHMGMSMEQQQIYHFLLTNPWMLQCGIQKINFKMMGLCTALGNEEQTRNAFFAFCKHYKDLVMYDEELSEVAVLNWPRMNLIDATVGALKKAERDLEEIESIFLLKEIIKRNSAGLSKMYLKRIRQINIEKINMKKVCNLENAQNTDDLTQITDNQSCATEKEKEKENNIYIVQNEEEQESSQSMNMSGLEVEENVGNDCCPEFKKIYDKYGLKRNKIQAEKAFKRLNKKERKSAYDLIDDYNKYLQSNPWQSKMLLSTWCNKKRFEDDWSVEKEAEYNLNDMNLKGSFAKGFENYLTYYYSLDLPPNIQPLTKKQFFELFAHKKITSTKKWGVQFKFKVQTYLQKLKSDSYLQRKTKAINTYLQECILNELKQVEYAR